MEIEEFIKSIEVFNPRLPPESVIKSVDYIHNGKESWDEGDDLNSEFRVKVVDLISSLPALGIYLDHEAPSGQNSFQRLLDFCNL